MKKNLDERLEEFAEDLKREYPSPFIFETLFWFALRNLKEVEEVETEVENCGVKVIWKNCPQTHKKRRWGKKKVHKRRNHV